jgi:NADH:ubiquinone oxidoreductase subunit 3 (subunit A)
MDNPSPYWFLVVFGAVALVFPLIPLALARLWFLVFSPQKPGKEKNAVYECGLESKGDSWVQMKSALLPVCDRVSHRGCGGGVFLIPFAAAYAALPVGAIVAMLVFVLLIAEGLVWAWGRGFLEWK